ncbi:MAG: hypothetical protein JNJ55_02345, partial [Betaproteobacteria bacterium]|nr:hypothetical protein [Betaproteobacteria bacterium]
MNNKLVNTAAALLLAVAATAQAGPGHDHSHDAPAISAGKASPRFEAVSDLFEVVGV